MGVETEPWWDELVSLRNEMTLRELSKRFGASVGDISVALRTTQTSRTAQSADVPASKNKPAQSANKSKGARAASTPDDLIRPIHDLLGSISDAEAAAKAGVSVRAIAAYRRNIEAGAAKAPQAPKTEDEATKTFRRSKIDPFRDIVGKLPDREVAARAGVTLNAVRNYRTNRDIPSSRTWARKQREQAARAKKVAAATASSPVQRAPVVAPAPASRPAAVTVGAVTYAWRVRFQSGDEGIVTGSGIEEAARKAAQHAADVMNIERLGQIL